MARHFTRTLRSIHRAAALRGLAVHFTIFAGTWACLAATGFDWHFFWPLVGWTLGLVMHGLTDLGPRQYFEARWERDQLRALGGAARSEA